MIIYKTNEEIEIMREAAQIVSRTLGMLAKEIKPGITTLYLDKLAEEYIRSQGAIPGFLGQYDFPNTLCMSPNEQVVHGFPNKKPLKEGDILSVDCGAILEGYWGDHAYTFEVGEVSPEKKRLLKVTKECLQVGIENMQIRKRVGDIGYAIQSHAENNGYGVVRELTGHGLGKTIHEEPSVPNFGRPRRGPQLRSGMVLAIEPMINMGTREVRQLDDGWTILTADKKPSAHFEHDVAIIDGKTEVLSTFDYVYEALGTPQEERII